jgi:hypothetical protein
VGDARFRAKAHQLVREAVEQALAMEEDYLGLVLRLGELGRVRQIEGDAAGAKEAYEQAVATAQRIWGEELLGKGMDPRNYAWLWTYLELLEEEAAAKGEDEVAARRRQWLGQLHKELDAHDEEQADAAVFQVRAEMRRACGAAATADGAEGQEDGVAAAAAAGGDESGGGSAASRRARLRLAARLRAAEARRLKWERVAAQLAAERAAGRQRVAAPAQAAMENEQGSGSESEEETTAAAAGLGDGDEEEELNECPICLMELEEGGETLACGHTFHAACVGEWVDTCRRKELTLACPYCRQAM